MKDNTITIGGWYSPSLDEATILKIKDCGLNMIFLEGDHIGNSCLDSSRIENDLKRCEENGIVAYVQKGKEVDTETAIDRDKKYSVYRSYLGLLLYDEPPAEAFAPLYEELKEYFARGCGREAYVNLLPSYARSDCILGDYSAYVEGFCEKFMSQNVRLNCLSFDYYPLIYGQNEDLCLADRWLYDTCIVAKNAKKYGVKANAFIQAMPFSRNGKKYGSRERIPSYRDLSLQFYVYLAFGFTSFTYFCLATPLENFEFSDQAYALLDKNNETTPIYDHAKKINSIVYRLGEALSGYRWEETVCVGKDEFFDFATDLKAYCLHGDEPTVKTDGKLLIGKFEKGKKKSFLFVNFGETTETPRVGIELDFGSEKEISVYRDGVANTTLTDRLSVSAEAGEGILITYEGI